MVTATSTRIPHAVQAGPAPTFLWLTLRIISLAMAVAPVLLLPVAGRHLIWHDNILVPDTILLGGILVAVITFVAVWLSQRGITSALNMRIPGQMRTLTREGAPSRTTRAPGLIASLVIAAAEVVAVFYAATHATGDHGVTALVLTGLGVCGVGIFVAGALSLVFRRLPGWKGDIGETALHHLPSALAMFSAGRFVAPRGELTDQGIAIALVCVLVVSLVIMWAFRSMSRGALGGSGLHDLAADVADGVLSRANAAPTLEDRRRATRLAQIAIYALIAGVVVIWLAIAFT